MTTVILVFFMTFTASIAAAFLKMTTDTSNGLISIFLNYRFYIGGVLYVCSALLNIWLLRTIDYSVAMPLGSVTYVFTIFVGRFLFHEKINLYKIVAIAFILLGVALIAMK